MKAVENHSDGQTRMGPGTLYDTLKRLLETGLVAESDDGLIPLWMTSAAVTTASRR
ncbi:hypothetical protein GCM10010840_27520 [Deinococcus aerolatus]|uniref:Transcription regulator PadR N-terminal domain-containing protein n=1 Tax=Deinococcus aerolatus TaxID=522487 RepID=A0ABQ2GDJ2_9DEIO|nr:helix-turn-helix transcriptional regulator [Deinococcus aerolatus]GGL87964.1 hypothetical protein GCM10010840_27520 [Deinococcus aerolatus]